MTRRAVQDFLKDNPSSLPTSRDAPKTPWEGTLLQAHVGSLVVFMYVDDPGRYFLDLFGKYPASEAQAVAAFGREEVARHRRQGEDLAVDRRISAAVDDAVRARDGVKGCFGCSLTVGLGIGGEEGREGFAQQRP